jgi:hypothetical protein
MNAKDNYRKKMNMNPNSYQGYMNLLRYGYNLQYVRNTLQFNQGFISSNKNDTANHPVFSEIAFMSGISETDWSWCPTVSDFDNDGFKDIIITNGYPRDVTDNDFVSYRSEVNNFASWDNLLSHIPQIKIPNYAFKNNGKLEFADVTTDWGLDQPSFSNGAVSVDLDNDGDLDYVVNNINDPASLYENTINERKEKPNFLQASFKGDIKNKDGYGAKLILFYNGNKTQLYEHTPFRGYLTSIDPIAHFGLGDISKVDSLKVIWTNGNQQVLKNVAANQRIKLDYKNASSSTSDPFDFIYFKGQQLFKDVSDSLGIDYVHDEADYVDFNVQKLLPHKMSEYGPGLAIADLDGNGMDDLVVSGSYPHTSKIFFQQANGQFKKDSILPELPGTKQADEMGILTFDADGDNDQDIFITSGGYEREGNSASYTDKFFVNDGTGHFVNDTSAFPKNYASKSCVRASDYDHDGDLDLFIAGRVDPWKYPLPVSSFIYRNDSKKGKVKFTDVTKSVAPGLEKIGLTCDALFTDFDNDGWQDLLLTGEWMPIMSFKNMQGKFVDVTKKSGTEKQTGFWNSISAGDFDNDGDMDYAVGNMGLNSFYRASEKYPARIYGKDFNADGNYDAVPTLFLRTSYLDNKIQEFPSQTRDDMIKQMISMRARFPNFNSYAISTIDKVLTEEERKGALVKEAVNFSSSILINDGQGHFIMTAMPLIAQVSNVNGMVSDDFDGDGNIDLILCGNDYGTEISVGRYDAMNGLLLKGNGKAGFEALSIAQSGIYIPGNAKAMVKLIGNKDSYQIISSQNREKLKVFRQESPAKIIRVSQNETYAIVEFKDGRKQKIEVPFGSSFLSQSSRFIKIGNDVSVLTIYGNSNQERVIRN